MPFDDALKLELIRAGLNACLLFLTWGIGQKIIAFYDLQKKRRELDLATEGSFHSLYGEFKDIGRLWRILKKNDPTKDIAPANTRWSLITRAASAEARIEALVMKLATERVLSSQDQRTLGLFRQAYQQLRESIRDDKEIKLSFSDPEYHFFNALSCQVAFLIARSPQADEVISLLFREQSLNTIIGVREDEYEIAISEYSKRRSLSPGS